MDTDGPVFGINDLCIEVTSAFPDLVFDVCSSAWPVSFWYLLSQKLHYPPPAGMISRVQLLIGEAGDYERHFPP